MAIHPRTLEAATFEENLLNAWIELWKSNFESIDWQLRSFPFSTDKACMKGPSWWFSGGGGGVWEKITVENEVEKKIVVYQKQIHQIKFR